MIDEYSLKIKEINHFLEINRYERAVDLSAELLGDNPENGKAYLLMALCQFGLENYEEAERMCYEALKYGEDEEQCSYLLAKIHLYIEKYKEAEKYFLRVLVLNPQNVNALAYYGYLMYLTGFEEKGEKLLNEALRIEPNNENALNYSFYFYLGKNKKYEQLSLLEKYYTNSNNEIRKYINAGMMDLYHNKYESAKDNFRQAYLLDPTNNTLLKMLESLDKKSSIFFLPDKIIEKIGGPAVLWIGTIVLTLIFYYLKHYVISVIIACIYIFFALYTWIRHFIIKIIEKRR